MLADHTPLQCINIPVSIYSSIPVIILDDQEKSLTLKASGNIKEQRATDQ
jgi:hypothetical protein